MESFLNPQQTLSQLNLSKGMVAADFGCGSGGWVIPLANILKEGKVYAVDLIEGPLSALNSTAKMHGMLNIQTMVSNVEKGTKISSGVCDLVLATNLLFECENKAGVLKEANRVLKRGGKLLLVDWKKSASFGPRDRAISPEEVKKLAQEAGFSVQSEFDSGAYHYGIIFTKP